jgi:N-acetylmuramoyl-L-alanine amidase
MIDFSDLFMLAICMWREARGDGRDGMVAVGCVVRNRVTRHGTTYYAEVVKPWQFSSISAHGDPQLGLYPLEADPSWQTAQLLATDIANGNIQDSTQGATLYYANSIPFPKSWNKAVIQATVTIGNQFFFREV